MDENDVNDVLDRLNRMKVRVPDSGTLEKASQLLADKNVRVFVVSEKRLFISTGRLSAEVTQALVALGATVVKDGVYDRERDLERAIAEFAHAEAYEDDPLRSTYAGDPEHQRLQQSNQTYWHAEKIWQTALADGADLGAAADEIAALYEPFIGGSDRWEASALFQQARYYTAAALLTETSREALCQKASAKLDRFDSLTHTLLRTEHINIQIAAGFRAQIAEARALDGGLGSL
jgi:hypothetical protein